MDTIEQARIFFLNALEHQNRGEWGQAEALYGKALELAPDRPSVINNLAAVLLMLKRYDEAESWCRKLLALDPRNVTGLLNLANCRLALKHPQAAVDILDAALAVNPDYAEALTSRGKALVDLKRYPEALASCDQALAIKPDHVEALNNRCVVMLELDQPEQALLDCDNALAMAPDFVRALANRSIALRVLGRFEEEILNYERLLTIAPDYEYGLGDLFLAMAYACDWSDYDSMVRRLTAGVQAGKRCCVPFAMIRAADSASDQLQCARIYQADRFPPSPSPIWKGDRYRHDRIRLAYLSADFQDHPAAYQIAGLFETHDRDRFETMGISFGPDTASEMRTRLENAFDHFIDVRSMSDLEVATLMRKLEIDIAVDQMGYTRDSRTGIFALRPAPLQILLPFYPGTLGTSYIDYILADRWVIPENDRPCYAEEVVYLPDTFLVNDRSRRIAETPRRSEAGLPEHGFVFCSFNGSYKITPALYDLWMRLLKQVTGSVLWLLESNPAVIRNLRREAAARGVAPDRLVFAPRMRKDEHLARYRLADLFLDNLPVNAGATASDALWAGLPVLTCAGNTFVGRVAASVLNAFGVSELITCSLQEYEALALRLATDASFMANVRTTLARNRATQPLFDIDRFRYHIESAYTTMWQRSQRGEPPLSFSVTPINLETAGGRG